MRICVTLVSLLAMVSAVAQQKLAVIGSSTSACTGPSTFANCYIAKLDAYYDGMGQPTDIFQLAVGGYNQYKGMPSSFVGPTPSWQPDPNNNITKALSLNPDVVLVNYPSNDYDVIHIDSIMRCLREIRDSANAMGKTCYITTTQPRNAAPFNTLANRTKLRVIRDSIMAAFGYFAIDFWTGIADPATYEIMSTYNADNIHLNNAGHQILFERVQAKNIFNVGLPVKLASFNARLNQDEVQLSWSVMEELPGIQYELQRSTDGTHFSTIQTFTCVAASSKRDYKTNDNSVVSGLYYYRLRITEDRRSFFSQVLKVPGGKKIIALRSLAMDRQKQQVVIQITAARSKRVQLNLISSAGVKLRRTDVVLHPGENRISLPLHSFAAGLYVAECIVDNTCIFARPFRSF